MHQNELSAVPPEISGYVIGHEIDRGGMAIVYSAVQDSVSRPAALKVLKAELASDETIAYRFLKEAKTLASLRHPNIVGVYDCGVENECYFLAMEYLSGGTLQDKLQQGLTVDQALQVTEAIASALDYAHKSGYIHRDVKPRNILFKDDGTPVLSDFGIVKNTTSNTQLTGHDSVIGTVRYMSPEQMRQNQDVDARSDLYSLGLILYQMLTGKLAHESSEIITLYNQRMERPVPTLPPHLARFQPILQQLLAIEPKQRFASAGELIRALQSVQRETTVKLAANQADAGGGSRLQRNLLYGAVAVLVATSLVLAFPAYRTWDRERTIVGLERDKQRATAAERENDEQIQRLSKTLAELKQQRTAIVLEADRRLARYQQQIAQLQQRQLASQQELESVQDQLATREEGHQRQLEQENDRLAKAQNKLKSMSDELVKLSARSGEQGEAVERSEKSLLTAVEQKRRAIESAVIEQQNILAKTDQLKTQVLGAKASWDQSARQVERLLSEQTRLDQAIADARKHEAAAEIANAELASLEGKLAVTAAELSELTPQIQAESYLAWARALERGGETANSLDLVDQGLELVPDHAELKAMKTALLDRREPPIQGSEGPESAIGTDGIDRLLALFEQQLGKKALITPSAGVDGTALDTCNRMQAQFPDNAQAKRCKRRISDKYYNWAVYNLDRGRLDDSIDRINKGLRVDGSNQRLQQLKPKVLAAIETANNPPDPQPTPEPRVAEPPKPQPSSHSAR